MRYISIIIFIILFYLLFCRAGTLVTPARPTPARPAEAGPTATPQVLEFTGSGGAVKQIDTSAAGVLLVTSTHRGDGNFIVDVYDERGDLVRVAANCIGNCQDQRMVQVGSAGRYRLEIKARGDWTVAIQFLD